MFPHMDNFTAKKEINDWLNSVPPNKPNCSKIRSDLSEQGTNAYMLE